jgi:hypothetical protein
VFVLLGWVIMIYLVILVGVPFSVSVSSLSLYIYMCVYISGFFVDSSLNEIKIIKLIPRDVMVLIPFFCFLFFNDMGLIPYSMAKLWLKVPQN